MNGKGNETQAPTRRVTVRDVVAVLFRRRWIIVGVFVVTTLGTAGVILSQPTVWESTGKVKLVRGIRDNLLQHYQRTLSWNEELATEMETARSPAVVRRAQAILDERREANGQEAYAIEIGRVASSVVGESNVIAISYQDREPEVCTGVTDALLDAFVEFRQKSYSLPYPSEFFETEIEEAQRALEALQEQRRRFLASSQIADVANERIHLLNLKLSEDGVASRLHREIAQMKAELGQMHEYRRDPIKYPDVPFKASHFEGSERVVADLKGQLVERQVRYAEMARVYQPSQPEMRRLEQEIAELRKLLSAEVDSRIRLAEMELAAHEAQLRETEGRQQEIGVRLSAMPHQEARLADLDREIRAREETYEDLLRAAKQAQVNQATSSEQTVYILAPASEPYKKNTRDYVRIALAPIFSLIVGLGLAFFVDGLDTTVRGPRDAEEVLDLPVLATLTEQQKR